MKILHLLSVFLLVLPGLDASEDRPDIIVIYTDDQGYGDVSGLNSEARFETPNMDRLMQEGIAFTNAHSSDSVCTPSRYGLLAGRYAWRTDRKRGVMGAEGACMIEEDRMTLASMLKDNGYHTALVGKWHLGMDFSGTQGNRNWSQPIEDMPLDRGFDYFFGVPASLNFGILAWFENRFADVPPTLYTNKKENPRYVDYRIKPPYQESPEATRELLGRPGFEVAPDFIDNQCLTRFTDKAIDWLKQRAGAGRSRKPFFLYLAYTSPHYPVCPRPQFYGKGCAGAYGEFVIETDYHVGRVLEFLEKADLDENTLIVFTSDNGPENSWTRRIEKYGHDSRGGFRGGKRSVYEGGHRVPFMVRWPDGIKEPGRKWDKIVGQVDLLATFAELNDISLPENAGEDSQSFLSVLREPTKDYDRVPLVNHGNDGRYSITEGHWKLVLPDEKHQAELYNLSSDPAEEINLIREFPEKCRALEAKMSKLIVRGRSTPGPAQVNDTGYWEDLHWMSKDEYNLKVTSLDADVGR